MPELPEVETVARGLDSRVRGQRIEHVWLGEKPEPLKSPAALIEKTLTGKRISQVHRVGKTVVIDLASSRPKHRAETAKNHAKNHEKSHGGPQWLVHLGMTGQLLVSDPAVPIQPHTHAIIRLSGGKEIRFVDPRRFGRLSIVEDNFTGEGREPLTISPKDFIALFRGRKTPIKAALLNQSLLHGVGNIYADESLFHAKIRPRRQAGRLTHAELARLREALQMVLREAIKQGGSSVSDYVDADGQKGFFQLHHHVYMRTAEPCKSCGKLIQRIVIAGRGTHYCPGCQR